MRLKGNKYSILIGMLLLFPTIGLLFQLSIYDSVHSKPEVIKQLPTTAPLIPLININLQKEISPIIYCSPKSIFEFPVVNEKRKSIDYKEWFLQLPNFIREEHRSWFKRYETYQWRNAKCSETKDNYLRFCEDDYTKGYVEVKQDVYLQETPGHDCGPRGDLNKLLRPKQDVPQFLNFHRIFWAVIPATWTFQHWFENTLPKLGQASFFVKNWNGITSNQELLLDRFPILTEIHRFIGFNLIDERTNVIHADELIYSCQTPPLHPLLWKLGRRFFGIPSSPSDRLRPRRLAYCSRNDQRQASNGGRRVLNEEELFKRVKEETDWALELFDPSRYTTIDSLIEYFSTEVYGIVGPHGGCLTNLVYMPCNSIVIEFLPLINGGRPPLGHPGYMMYMQATMLDMEYWLVPVNTPNGNGDCEVDPGLLIEIINKY